VIAKLAISIILGVYLTGCTFSHFSPSVLNIVHRQELARPGPLAKIAPRKVHIGEFTDRRQETDKIGYHKAFGRNTSPIVAANPISHIVREALRVELLKNGHVSEQNNPDFTLSGEISSFWFNYSFDVGMLIDYKAIVAIKVHVVNAKTGVTTSRYYSGYYTRLDSSGTLHPASWERAMNAALSRTAYEFSTDAALVELFKG
jgi:hypothetical protein